MSQYNMHEAKTQLSQLVERALMGEEIVIARKGKPVVRLTPLEETQRRPFGLYEGKIWVSDDFDAPIPEDLLEGML
jgi:prevent-host-death family protein